MNWELEQETGNWKARWGPDVDDATKPTVCNPMPGTPDHRSPVQITEKTKSQAPKPDREERRGGERSGEERRGEERRGEERSGEERRGEERGGEERRKEMRKETLGDGSERCGRFNNCAMEIGPSLIHIKQVGIALKGNSRYTAPGGRYVRKLRLI